MSRPWIVLKYGGTSVATPDRWEQIAARIDQARPAHRVWVVVSALAGTTNRLEQLIAGAREDQAPEDLGLLAKKHRELAGQLGIPAEALTPVDAIWEDIARRLEGIRLTGEAPPRLRARILAAGELASSRLGAAYLEQRNLPITWVDSRDLLTSAVRSRETEEARYLRARVRVERDPRPAEEAAGDSPLVIAPGFVARTRQGDGSGRGQ